MVCILHNQLSVQGSSSQPSVALNALETLSVVCKCGVRSPSTLLVSRLPPAPLRWPAHPATSPSVRCSGFACQLVELAVSVRLGSSDDPFNPKLRFGLKRPSTISRLRIPNKIYIALAITSSSSSPSELTLVAENSLVIERDVYLLYWQ